MTTFHQSGPLAGMASVTIVLDARTTHWMRMASIEMGRDIDDLARIATEEAALEWAKSNGQLENTP